MDPISGKVKHVISADHRAWRHFFLVLVNKNWWGKFVKSKCAILIVKKENDGLQCRFKYDNSAGKH